MKPASGLLQGSTLFHTNLGIYVNRVEETFELHYHAHDFIELTYVSEGSGFHYIGEQVIPVRKGHLFMLPIGTSHILRPSSTNGRNRLIVYNCIFTESAWHEANAAVHDLSLSAALRLADEERQPEGFGLYDHSLALEPLFASMLEEHSLRRPGYGAVLQGMLTRLLVVLARESTEPTSRRRSDGHHSMEQSIAYMQDHIGEELTIRFMSEMASMSERHYFRLFKQHTGHTFQEWLQHTRVRAACELLASTDFKVALVAEQAGYRDTQSFGRVFRAIAGMTPSEYRRSLNSPIDTLL
ncbi:helix-turn-helix domain-containing protein [Paenibacillus sp. GCM10023252]|uniref:helix-turn-helix domain-containing protein n=1 Tax=Paenibacillus sp. GCM10023252 TaxID=3252649 RepID=UPI003612D659